MFQNIPKLPSNHYTSLILKCIRSKTHHQFIYVFFNWKGKKFYVTSLHWFLKTLIADTLKPVVGETWRYLRNKKKICNLFPDKTHPDNECYPNEIRNLFLMKCMDWKVMGAKAGRERIQKEENPVFSPLEKGSWTSHLSGRSVDQIVTRIGLIFLGGQVFG